MHYRRAKIKGGTYFFTVVTPQRRKILCEPDNVAILHYVFRSVKTDHPFTIDAVVLLLDHLHCIWTLPESDDDFSTRWHVIKSELSRRCDPKYKQSSSESRLRKREQAIWQQRFWEHPIRDEKDFIQHVECDRQSCRVRYAREPIAVVLRVKLVGWALLETNRNSFPWARVVDTSHRPVPSATNI